MKNLNIRSILTTVVSLAVSALALPSTAFAATSPVLTGSSGYSVLGGAAVTCTGPATTTGSVGVSPGTSITGFPVPCTAGGSTHSNDASAIAAQADNLATFGALDQPCDRTFGAQDLTLLSPLGPGVYCSTSSFSLSGNLRLTGSGVWIFKTVSTLITSPGSSVTGGDPCNVWWRIGSSATLATTTSFIGSILALNGVTALQTNATLNGRVLAQSAGTVTLDSNTITGPTCAVVAPTPTATTPAATTTTPASTTTTTAASTSTPATSSSTPAAPKTGFGVHKTNQWQLLTAYGFGAAGAIALGLVVRRFSNR
ncbi:MAG TPA: ice-binding family protein [Patescibacteria group bacterium]|jgi:hypothetical protein|nr:ice-binding family protein [Patescibacteria group bacterium]